MGFSEPVPGRLQRRTDELPVDLTHGSARGWVSSDCGSASSRRCVTSTRSRTRARSRRAAPHTRFARALAGDSVISALQHLRRRAARGCARAAATMRTTRRRHGRPASARAVSGPGRCDRRAAARTASPGPVLDVGCGPGSPPACARRSRSVRARRRPLPGRGRARRRRRRPRDRRRHLRRASRRRKLAQRSAARRQHRHRRLAGTAARAARRRCCTPAGELLVELEPPGESTCSTHARLESDGVASAWFPWARVAAPAIAPIAARGRLFDGRRSGRCLGGGSRACGATIAGSIARPGAPADRALAPARYREPVPVLEARGITKTVGRGRAQRRVLDGSRSTSMPTRLWPCSGAPGAASRRCCICWAASIGPTRARSCSPARGSPTRDPAHWPARGSVTSASCFSPFIWSRS